MYILLYSNEVFSNTKVYSVLYGILSMQKWPLTDVFAPNETEFNRSYTRFFIRVDCQVGRRKEILLFTKDLKQNHISFITRCTVEIRTIKLEKNYRQ